MTDIIGEVLQNEFLISCSLAKTARDKGDREMERLARKSAKQRIKDISKGDWSKAQSLRDTMYAFTGEPKDLEG